MKKLYLLLLLLPLAFLGSCNDDDEDFPRVDIKVTLNGVVQDGNTIYAVQGEPVTVQSAYAESLNGMNSALSMITYYLNGAYMCTSPASPFPATVNTSVLNPGLYEVSMRTCILQEDKEIVRALIGFNFVLVDSFDELPDPDAQLGTVTLSYRVDPQ